METERINCWKLSSPRRRKISHSCMYVSLYRRKVQYVGGGFQYSLATVFLSGLRHSGSGHRSKKVKVMVRNSFQMQMLVAVTLAAAQGGMAATIIGGLEDSPGSSGFEKNGDFNDMIFEMSGNVTIDAPGGVFNNLTSAVVNQSGTVFWDNRSGDGPDMNVGYCLLGEATCPLDGGPV